MDTFANVTDASTDELAARTIIKDYGDISIVMIPDCSTLLEVERTAVLDRVRQWQMATPLCADTLTSKLRYITPPVDEEEEKSKSRMLEAQARKELEIERCPPCYPHNLEIPSRNPPEKYRAIIKYWESFPGTDDVVLCAQLSDWRKFRTSQRGTRGRFGNKYFNKFVNEVYERRRRHALDGHVCLLFKLEQQSRLADWIEFQNYHLERIERFEKKRDDLRKELCDTRKKPVEDTEAIRQGLQNTERDLELHKILLSWIERERQIFPPSTSRAIGSLSARTKPAEASAVLGKARITKANTRNRDKCQDTKPRHTKRWHALQQSQLTSEYITTRSGRISKPPARY